MKRRNKRRNGKEDHKEYMAQYMFRWRRKYRKASYKQENGKNGTDTGGAHPSIIEENGNLIFIEERDLVQKQKRRSLGKI